MDQEAKPTILQHLYVVQKNLKAPKNQYNSYGGFHYRSCEDILEALKEVMPHGCAVTLSDEIIESGSVHKVDQSGQNKTSIMYVKATATFHFDGQTINSTGFARENLTHKKMNPEQTTGSAGSYARKYALNGLFMIDDNKDADDQKPENLNGQQPAYKPPVTHPAVTPAPQTQQQQQPWKPPAQGQQQQQGAWNMKQGQ